MNAKSQGIRERAGPIVTSPQYATALRTMRLG